MPVSGAEKQLPKDATKVEDRKGGWFVSIPYYSSQSYEVDTKARLCFRTDAKVLVPCANLKYRGEWYNIITWE